MPSNIGRLSAVWSPAPLFPGATQDTINPTPPQKVAMIFAYKDMYADIGALYSGEQELPAASGPGQAASSDAIEVDMHSSPQAIAIRWRQAHMW